MNGAHTLVQSLTTNGIELCFANPGTSEMHFVAALDQAPELRCVLGLFEGVVTGAADGYARMTDQPAATLLHLGPGLANGLSNLHNARRAHSPIVNIIGDHATYHRNYDAPLTSDVEGTARPFSDWVRTSPDAASVATDAAAAISAARGLPGRIASLILPANTAWTEVTDERVRIPLAQTPVPEPISDSAVRAAAKILTAGGNSALLLNPRATREYELRLAGAIVAATGAEIIVPTHMARISRGTGRVPVRRIPYGTDHGIEMLSKYDSIILIGAKPPVAFFAYPNKPSQLFAAGTLIHELARPDQHVTDGLEALVDELSARTSEAVVTQRKRLDFPTGTPTPAKISEFLGAAIPENSIVVDESLTTGRSFLKDTEGLPPHDWILSTGGSIGYALSNSIGAAIACPDRKVVVLQSDGSGLYMPQALWTQAREGLDIVTLVFANRKYQILRNEMKSVGADFGGPKAEALMDIGDPVIDWVSLGKSFGVESSRAETMEALQEEFENALLRSGPSLIEIVL
ncbi:acetolactate synthase large subunit [Microbacterium profundi]